MFIGASILEYKCPWLPLRNTATEGQEWVRQEITFKCKITSLIESLMNKSKASLCQNFFHCFIHRMTKQTFYIKVKPFYLKLVLKELESHTKTTQTETCVGAIKSCSCGWKNTRQTSTGALMQQPWLLVSLQQFRVQSPRLACGMYTSTCLSPCGFRLMQRFVWCYRINKPSEIAN
jgi:hypothetical protein